MIQTENFKKITVKSQAELRKWLAKNHSQIQSVLLVTFKKHIPVKYVSVGEILDELLCFGWIDGIRRKLDEDKTMQLISPRKSNHWTKTYKERFARLEEEGKMTDAGREKITLSKNLQLWDYMDDVDALKIPVDFKRYLKKHPLALAHFQSFPESVQRFTLRWIKMAKTDETRTKRMEKASLLASLPKLYTVSSDFAKALASRKLNIDLLSSRPT